MNPADEEPSAIDPAVLAHLLAADAALDDDRAADSPGGPGWEADCLEVLDRAWPALAPGADEAPPPESIGRYLVIRELGRGGFGVVYLAQDPETGREVALKVPLPGLAHSADVRRRFTREARAVAGLDHPNIVPVHDARTVGPVAFIASAYCPGPSLAAWLKDQAAPVPVRVAVRLAMGLAWGVAHAHARGILHRDLKPANVMLQPGGPPESAGMTPRLTDFGLAKVANEANLEQTRAGLVIGSAPYMAPEQAMGAGGDVGPATDVYALGVILYEMLVGRPPFVGRSQAEMLHQVLHGELIAPHLFRREIPRDLQTICLHALKRNPKARYPTAEALAVDLDRLLAGEPIVARPPSLVERSWRWAAKHPAAATLAGSVALLIVLINLGMGWANARLRQSNDQLSREVERADRHALEVDRHLRAARLNLARQAIEAGQDERAQAILADASTAAGPHLRDFAWTYLWNLSRRHLAVWGHHEAKVRRVVLSPDGTTLASGDRSGRVQVWDVATGRLKETYGPPIGTIEEMAFSPDGTLLAVAGFSSSNPRSAARISLWAVGSGRSRAWFDLAGVKQVSRVCFVAGGQVLVALVAEGSKDLEVMGWSLAALKAGPTTRLDFCYSVPGCRSAVVAPDGRSLWTSEADGRLNQRDARTGKLLRTLATGLPAPVTLAASPDGRWLAAATPPARVHLWDLAAGGPARTLVDLAVRPDELIFRPKANALLAISGGIEVRLIDLAAGGPGLTILPLDLDRRGGLDFGFSPDGRWLVSCGEIRPGGGGQPVTVRDAATGQVERVLPGQRPFSQALFDAGSRAILVANDYDIAAWHPFEPLTEAVTEFVDHQDEVWAVAFAPDGKTLASGGDDNHLRFWDPATRVPSQVVNPHNATVAAVAWHPGGRLVASGGLIEQGNLKLWDLQTHLPVASPVGHTAQVRTLAFSPDGAVLASAGSDRSIRLWDGATGSPLGLMNGHEDIIRGLVFAPDGRHLVSISNDATIRVWDRAGWRPRAVLTEQFELSAVAYSPDGTTLASADERGRIQLRDTTTWETRRAVQADDREIRALAYSPDGETLVAAGKSGVIQFWDPATGQPLMELRGRTTDQVNALAFSPDGSTLIVADHGGQVRIYRAVVDR